VWFNRDEKKARPIAEAPALRFRGDVSFLSPRDPQGGGTWMLVNEFGLVVCLLNRWDLASRAPQGRRRSRGQLVWSMAGARTADDLGEFLEELEFYPAFTLVGLSAESQRRWEWDGGKMSEAPVAMPLTSSSYCYEAVKKAREKSFEDGKRGHEFHGSRGEEVSAFTVRMNRPDAQTWSRSHLTIGRKITWNYLAEPPDLIGESRSFRAELALR